MKPTRRHPPVCAVGTHPIPSQSGDCAGFVAALQNLPVYRKPPEHYRALCP